MVVNKRKKQSRQRGSTTHGWGSKKKHRGAGSRGGRGMAGTGKRADSKKPSIWWFTKYFGKYGFKSKNKKSIRAINISDIDKDIQILVEEKLARKENDFFVLDLAEIGYHKLLGTGQVRNKYKIKALQASKKAVEKVSEAGGVVELAQKEVE